MKNRNLLLVRPMRAALLFLLLTTTGMTKSLAQEHYGISIGDLKYYLNDNTLTAEVRGHVNGTSATGPLTIPSSVTWTDNNDVTRTYSVKWIGNSAFYGCSGFTGSPTIPNSVTTIGFYAFYNCSGFTGSLTIPNSVTTIGSGAFCNCSGFTGSLTIPNSVTTIRYAAFDGCSGFTGSLTIPNSVTTIEYYAFRDCSGLTEVHFNAANCGDVYIGNVPFQNCGCSLVIGSNVERIPNWMFQNAAFTASTIPNSVTEIGEGAFYGCTNFTGSLTIPNSVRTIGNSAFNGCSGFNGNLVLNDSLQTIGAEAFRYCGGFQGELTLPETLISVGSYAFAGCNEISTINYNAIHCDTMGSSGQNVFYDCISVRHIRIGENVESIPNYAFKGCFMVQDIAAAAEVPPTIASSTFGTVSREIPVSVPYGSGADYRSAPYWEEFFHITEDYSPSQYSYHWTVNTHQFADNMTAIGVIEINGVEQATDALEIGAFCGDECRGRQLMAYYPDFDRYLLFLTIYGEDGDALSFRLYDHEAGAEIDMGCTTHLTFLTDDIIGTLTEPHPFNFVAMQDVQFAAGWNWWSACIELDDNGLTQLQESLDTHGMMIKSQNDGYASYLDGFGWYGSLAAINNENTYQIHVSEDCAVGIAGTMAHPEDHPITLNSGWTWIGYPVNGSMSVVEALSGIEPQTNDMLKSQNNGFASYLDGFGWYGSLSTLQPGMGLMFKSNAGADVTLIYPDGGLRTDLKANQTSEANHWQPNLNAYPDNMSVMAIVELDGEELQGEQYELAAFANGEVRGSARLLYVEPINRYMAFLTVAGDEAAELHFGLYNTETGVVETQCIASLQYETNAIVGSFDEPYVVSFHGNTGLDEWYNSVQVYPNPIEHSQPLNLGLKAEEASTMRIEIINALGAVVETYYGTTLKTITAPETAGVYTLRITVEGKGSCYRKLVVR